VEGLPGSTWGNLHLDLPSPGTTDLVLEGWARQGVAWARWEAGRSQLLLQTYATLRYKWDSEGLDWNDYLGPGVGLSLDLRAPGGQQVSAGLEYVRQWNFRAGTRRPYLAPFLGWYHWWELGQGAWPGSTWGELRWQLPDTGRSNLILQGWLDQGLVLARWQGAAQTVLLTPYLRLRYGVDAEGLDWNNYLGPGVGLALALERPRWPLLSWGVEYAWEQNLRSADGVHRLSLFMRWYAWWNLGGR
jgi:hypothetical protein